MEVLIKGEVQDLRVSTITLQPEATGTVYAFHCTGCGNFHQQVGGKVSKIYPFYEPTNQVLVISTCTNCGKKYNFQTHDGYLSSKIRVILHPTKDMNYFYCAQGKHRVLEYTNSMIRTVGDNKLNITPFFARCFGQGCDKVYFFAEKI